MASPAKSARSKTEIMPGRTPLPAADPEYQSDLYQVTNTNLSNAFKIVIQFLEFGPLDCCAEQHSSTYYARHVLDITSTIQGTTLSSFTK